MQASSQACFVSASVVGRQDDAVERMTSRTPWQVRWLPRWSRWWDDLCSPPIRAGVEAARLASAVGRAFVGGGGRRLVTSAVRSQRREQERGEGQRSRGCG